MGGAFTDPRRVEPLFDVITHKWMHVAHTFDSRPYEEEDAARIFRSIVTAVARLHSVNIVHGNLAPDHILLDMDDDTKVYLPDLRWAGQITVESGVTQPLCFQVSPTPATRFRPYLAHFAPVFSRFLRVFTVSTRRFQRTPSRNPGPRDRGKGAQTPFWRSS